jgi:hypothetical protein
MRWDDTRHPADLPQLHVSPGPEGGVVASSLGRSTRVRRRRPPVGILEASRHPGLPTEPWRASGARLAAHSQWLSPPAGVLRRRAP